jgi:glutamyl-tRNA reductase
MSLLSAAVTIAPVYSCGERLAFPSAQTLANAYERWKTLHPGSELVILSTCNRVELYAADEQASNGIAIDDVINFLSRFHNLPADDFASCADLPHRPRGRQAPLSRHLQHRQHGSG